MGFETIIYEKGEGRALLTLNRPQQLNAISSQVLGELEQAFVEAERDEEVRVAILTGGEKCFSAGADLKEKRPPDYLKRFRALLYRIENLEKPVIAAITGVAYGGGCELALACDLRLASPEARFGLPEVKIGSMPSAGGTQRLPRLVGMTRAKEMMFLGDPIMGEEAFRLSLVNRVVPAAALMEEAKRLAGVLAERPPLSLRMIKSAINTSLKVDLESGLDYEARCASFLATTEDRQEGVRAFIEKRKPIFKGR